MDIARYAIDRRVNTWLLILFCLFGGVWGFFSVGKLEDPAFTIKQAIVVTHYQGATALEVEEEVTEVLETAIQQLGQVDTIKSRSEPGYSEIEIEIKASYDGTELPQVWDELRRKVNDAQGNLPSGAGPSAVVDDFGDVYGIYYAVTAPGFTDRQTLDVSDFLRRELLTVEGVAKVSLAGEPTETVYIETTTERLASLGIAPNQIIAALEGESAVAPTGSMRIQDKHVRISVPSPVGTAADLGSVKVGRTGTAEQISLSDMARITRQPTEIPQHIIRFNGERAFTVAISGVEGANIVDVGNDVADKLAALAPEIPLGIEIHPIYEQHVVVDESVYGFVQNLAMSVAIVVGVLLLFMGWRMALVVGATLFLTVSGTVLFMAIFGLQMERISLGALIIAMGMLVDNALVIAEGMLIAMQRGSDAREAASNAARRTQIPLLGATVIGIMAFAGIGLSNDSTGEFLFSLFAVIAISLTLSWLLAITVTPLLGHYLLRPGTDNADADPYGAGVYRTYQGVLRTALAHRRVTLLSLIALTGLCMYGFGFVKQSFFPNSNTPMFYVDYYLPQGSDIRATAEDIEAIEKRILEDEDVVSVASFIGQGATRYTLTYNATRSNSAYAQFIIRTASLDVIPDLADRVVAMAEEQSANAQVWSTRIVFGPGGGAKLQPRFSGPDPEELRRYAEQTMRILADSGAARHIRQNWRQQELVVVPRIRAERANLAGIDRTDVANALQFATEGVRAGVYRDGDELIPIVARPPDNERLEINGLNNRLIWSSAGQAYVPLTQVVERFDTVSQEVVIRRQDRLRTLTVEANPVEGLTASEALAVVKSQVEAIPLKPGYTLEWGGEYENSAEAQAALGSQLPLTLIIMLAITVLLFAKVRQPLVIWSIVPMSICGVTVGLIVTGLPFSFTALLGLLSLSGMLIKNAIVLVDEIDDQIGQKGMNADAVTRASVSRLRPVFLAAATTILGMMPLLPDAFFASMAVTIMGGLAFATVLTLIAAPVIYALLFGISPAEKSA